MKIRPYNDGRERPEGVKMTKKKVLRWWRATGVTGNLEISYVDFECALDVLSVPNKTYHDRITLFESGELRIYLGPDVIFRCPARMVCS